MRCPAPEAPIHGHAPAQEAKTTRKKMAVGGTVYTIDPLGRTPEEVAPSLWHSPDADPPPSARPVPQPQRLWARLPPHQDHHAVSATETPCGGLAQAVGRRNPRADQPMLWLMEGHKALWDAGQRAGPTAKTMAMLALWPATPRRWDAAPLCYGRDEAHALRLGYDRVLRLRTGEGRSVVAGLRQRGTKRKRRGKKRAKLANICADLDNNAQRMRDDGSLAAGYPIASGVIEGAWRHCSKDRMERSGMRGTIASAQAMLDRRRTSLNGDWDDCMRYRIGQETPRLSPYRALVEPRAALEEIDLPRAA